MFSVRVIVIVLIAVVAVDAVKIGLHLLTLVPLSDSTNSNSSVSCLNRGEELLPAARLAADIVNRNILNATDFQIEIVPIETALCDQDSFSSTLANFVQELTNPDWIVVGVVGMMCSSSVLSVSPLASRSEINLLQISAGPVSPDSISKAREGRVTSNRLFHIVPASTIFNDALVQILKPSSEGASTIAVIRHIGAFFIEHDVIAQDLRGKVDNSINIIDYEIEFGNAGMESIINSIITNEQGIRVIYASVTMEEARRLLCAAFTASPRVLYPRNQWIFHSFTLEDLLQPVDRCSVQDMQVALTGTILLHYSPRNLPPLDDNLSYTNLTYGEFLENYRQELSDSSISRCDIFPGIVHTNGLFDSVLSFGLAINNTLEFVTHKELINYRIPNTTDSISNITSILLREVENLSFNGASGTVMFNNTSHGISGHNQADIMIVDNGINTKQANVSRFVNASYDSIRVAFSESLGIPITTIVIAFILVVAHSITLLLFFYYWNDSIIRATSPPLSIVIFTGCFMLDLSMLLTAFRNSFASESMIVPLCILEDWLLFIGIQLIFAALLMRLLRVYRIFFYYSKLGKIWNDSGLLLFVLLLTSGGVIILSLWMIIDTPKLDLQRIFKSSTENPHYIIQVSCQSQHSLWIWLLLAYTGLTMIVVLFLAIKTRKVKIDSFKDTRAVNIFIYITVSCFVFSMILSLLFDSLQDKVLVFVFRVLALGSVAIACACFLFFPKIYSAQYERRHPRRKSIVTINCDAMHLGNSNKHVMTSSL